MPADPRLKAGSRLGRYEIVGELGAGGMGTVYLAEDTRLGRRVAIKLLPPELAGKEELVRRFEREARAVAALNHPNIVTLFTVEDEASRADGGRLRFLTMEWVDGETLGRKIVAAGLPLSEFFDLAVPLVEAVAAAHRAGVVHRDVKPANVMVTRGGRVKVLDFGIAKLERSESGSGEAVTELTREGLLMGTVQYMAPEQALGRAVGPAADVFALGVLLYEMLSGRRPFEGASGAEVASAILRDDPPPIESRRPGLPSDLAALVRRCLEKRSERRFPSAAELHEALAAAQRAFQRSQLLGEARPGDLEAAPTAVAEAPPPRVARGPSVAVLGFHNLLGDAAAEWLSTGITETVTVDLKKLPGLTVVSRDTLLRELGADAPASVDPLRLREVGMRLGVDWIVRGAFQKLGDSIRITASFVDVAAGELLESVKLDGTMAEIFVLQDRIVRELAATLDLEGPRTSAAGPADAEQLAAYECYARGVELVARMDAASLEEGRAYLERAIALDPGYALAYSGLGYLHAMRFIGSTDRADLERSVEHLERAAAIDPELGEPWVWLGYDFSRLGRYDEAIEASRKAIELEPDNPLARYIHGVALYLHAERGWERRRLDVAVREFREATRLAPRYQPAHQLLGALYLAHGQYDDARPPLDRAAEIEAGGSWELARFVGAHALLGRLHLRSGDADASRAAYERSLQLTEGSEHFYVPMVRAASLCGLADLVATAHPDRALTLYRQAREFAERHDRALGIGWLVVRARLGMASSFRRLRMRREEEAALAAARELLGSRRGFDFSALWDDGPGPLHYELARHFVLRREPEPALDQLTQALDYGWSDRSWLERDELLAALAEELRFNDCLEVLRARPPLQ